jgi:hypothetical protein
LILKKYNNMISYDTLGRIIAVSALLASINFGCQSADSTQNQSESASQQLPWPIMVPEGAEIEQDGGTEITIKKGVDYGVKLSQMDLDAGHPDSLWAKEKKGVMDLPGFTRFIKQEDTLWIYELAPEQSQAHYGFRLRKKVDSKWWLCESALAGSWDSLQVSNMIQSLK